MTTHLQKRIQRRVYAIYVLRTLLQPFLVKVYIALALIWQASGFVSVSDVFTNATSSARSFDTGYIFYTTALTNTEGMVQIAIFGVLVIGVLALRDIARRGSGGTLQKA